MVDGKGQMPIGPMNPKWFEDEARDVDKTFCLEIGLCLEVGIN
jgi:hypothetical protein